MNPSRTEPAERLRWDALDGALARLRRCRAVRDLTECAAGLAIVGCGADAVALGQVTSGVWTPWLRAGNLVLLDGEETVPAVPMKVHDAPALEQRVLRSGVSGVRHLPESARRAQVVVAALASGRVTRGLLHVVGRDLDVEIVETYASALAAMLDLVCVRQLAEEQRHVLARLRGALGEPAERPIELVGAPMGRYSPSTPTVEPRRGPTAPRERLTARQREVLDLMMAGLSNTEIAEQLVVALPTVKSHVRAVLRASGAVNRSEALARFSRAARRDHRSGDLRRNEPPPGQ